MKLFRKTATTRQYKAFGLLAGAAILLCLVVIAALRADGQSHLRASYDDGGVWVVNRSLGQVAHANLELVELSGAFVAAEEGDPYTTRQAPGAAFVHNYKTAELGVIDPRAYAIESSIQLGDGYRVDALAGGALITDPTRGMVWRLDRSAMLNLPSLDAVEPVINLDEPVTTTATKGDGAFVVGTTSGRVVYLSAEGKVSARSSLSEEAATAAALDGHTTAVGEALVILDNESRQIIRVSSDGATSAPLTPIDGLISMQISGHDSESVIVATGSEVASIDLTTGAMATVFELGSAHPVRPVLSGGCVHGASASASLWVIRCGEEPPQQHPISLGGSGELLELFEVNGRVWINDAEFGMFGAVDDSGEPTMTPWDDDIVFTDGGAESDQPSDDNGRTELVQDPNEPDSELADVERKDENGVNDPPIAVDDEARTRPGRAVEIPVVANDEDEDGDPLIVESFDVDVAGGTTTLSGNRTAIYFEPDRGFTGRAQFTYSVSDGQAVSADKATVTVEMVGADENNKPEPRSDAAITTVGVPVTVNVLDNDVDPEGDPLALVSASLTAASGDGQELTFSPNGEVTLAPGLQRAGTSVTVSYVATDGALESDNGTLTVVVLDPTENHPPVARNDVAAGLVNRPVTINVLSNDTDPDGDLLTVPTSNVVSTTDADVDIDAAGNLTVTSREPGDLVLSYSVSDGDLDDTAVALVSFQDVATSEPIAHPDRLVVPLGGSAVVDVLANDTDGDGDVLSIVGWEEVDGLRIEQAGGTSLRVTATSPETRRATFTYRISDGTSVSRAIVTVTVVDASPQRAPVARGDVFEIRAGRVSTLDVLRNDYDPNNGRLVVVSVSELDQGVAAVRSDGQALTVDVPAGITGSFTLNYETANAEGIRSSASVQVSVVPDDQNRPPVARPDTARTRIDQDVVVNVLGNDSDPDGDQIRIGALTRQPVHGSAEVLEAGQVRYTPIGTVTGTDEFAYTIIDDRGLPSGEVTVRVGVIAKSLADENRAPTAVTDQIELRVGGTARRIDLTANDIDPDGDALTVAGVSNVAAVTATVDPSGSSVSFTPPDSFDFAQGNRVSLTYTIDDGNNHQVDGIVDITLLPQSEQRPPVALDDEIGPLVPGETVNLDVLANDSDPDGNRSDLTLSGVTVGTSGSARIERNRVAITAGDTSATHRYEVTDAEGNTTTAQISVTVLPNAAPTAVAGSLTTTVGQPARINLEDLTKDSSDDTLTFEVLRVSDGITARLDPASTGSWVQVSGNRPVVGSFAYRATDSAGNQASATVTVTIKPTSNSAPTAQPATVTVTRGGTARVDLASYISDPDPGDNVRVGFARASSNGVRVSVVAETVTVTAADNAQSTAFEFTVTDLAGATDTATLAVTVEKRAQAVVAVDDGPIDVKRSDGVVTLRPLTNDIGDGLEIVSSTLGTLEGGGSTIAFDPGRYPIGRTIVSYTVANDQGNKASARITVNIVDIPGMPGVPVGQAGPQEIKFVWTPAATNGSAITQYELEIQTAGGPGISTIVRAGTAYTATGLASEKSYSARVRATNQAGESPWSALSSPSSALPRCLVPKAPTAPTVILNRWGQPVVSWDAPAQTGGCEITNYEIRTVGTGRTVASTPARNYDFGIPPGFEPGSDVQFQTRAINTVGASDWSPPSKLISIGAPAPAPSLRPYCVPHAGCPTSNSGMIVVEIVASPGYESLEYALAAYPVGGGISVGKRGLTPGTNQLTGLTNGVSYDVIGTSINQYGDSHSAPFRIKVVGAPSNPLVTATYDAVNNLVRVQWSSDPAGSSWIRYSVSWSGGGQGLQFETTDSGRDFTPTVLGVQYRIAVRPITEWTASHFTRPPAEPYGETSLTVPGPPVPTPTTPPPTTPPPPTTTTSPPPPETTTPQ